MKQITSSLCRTLLASSLALLSGCAGYSDLPAGTIKPISGWLDSAVVEKQEVSVDECLIAPPPAPDYLIGANDVLYINIEGRPEFMVTPTGGNSKIQGSRVDGSGAIQLPIAGAVQVAGLTVAQAQAKIREKLRTYLKDPWVVVEVAEYKSHPLYLLGQFRSPGTVYMDRPLNLSQGIALGNGFDITADLRGARINRGNRILPVDVYDLLVKGCAQNNIWLQAGDTIFIPDNRNQQVFVFGAVKKPGPITMLQSGLNLAQAIGSAELRDTGYDFKHVRIIRSLSPTRGELLVVDFDRILRGEAVPLPLMAGDIIYVPRSHIGRWNDVIAEILPSLQAVSAVLQPFVNIKYLTDNN
ncbi:MAG: sugar transporter [Deltaproteobacteria bacterium]|nr:sugar transporter [Deltaproteobacteria bacterium]